MSGAARGLVNYYSTGATASGSGSGSGSCFADVADQTQARDRDVPDPAVRLGLVDPALSGAGSATHFGGFMGDMGGVGMSGEGEGLDVDLDLTMDMDMDLSHAGGDGGNVAEVGFGGGVMGQHQQQQMGASRTEQMMGGRAVEIADGDGTPTTAQSLEAGIMAGAGAGPLPTGFGMAAQQNGSTLTEFTKRRNWSQRVIEELKDFLHILTPDGRILYVSPSCKAITGHESHSLLGKFIGEYVHPDDSGIFMREFNESIASGNSLRFFYRFKKDDGTYIIFECDGHPHISQEPHVAPQGYNASMSNGGSYMSGQCRGFFMMARPYPTKNAALLDSFLEHKIENERLMKRIEELKREEQVENVEQDRLYREQTAWVTGMTPSESHQSLSRFGGGGGGGENASETPTETPNYQGMPPPAKPSLSNTALTRQNLDSALMAQKPDSIADKMSRYEANSTHLESIELMTGLRYRDGERSHGISTGDTSPALIRGDAGIAILLDRDREGNKKEKKKLKVADEYVCADCGTLDSPEWRKGPKGPKTLCNACGLRWAKKEKKRGGDDGKDGSPVGAGVGGSAGQMSQISGTAMPAMLGQQVPSLQMQSSNGSSQG
ncbi:white collar 2 type of transcription factor [Recurvomyces mirabilis]|uniref:White collar 2 type of transcription factor n=1 Tax=Recurvomyces mirabilis TaxID=574656 RepID=A0AAE0WH53_9PEZI|nr:white collar 2 type of transcription factor [Recurvomyces mirabilis]KAK5160335.1 white collar 2 type of transcription factor [Recurvomyces mirabilis]